MAFPVMKGCAIKRTSFGGVPVFSSRPTYQRKQSLQIFAAKKDTELVTGASAAFMLTLSTLAASAPAWAASSVQTLPRTSGTGLPSTALPSAITSTAAPDAAIDQAVQQITDAIKAAGGAIKSGLDVAADGAGRVKGVADQASPYVKKGIDVVSPFAKATANVATEVAKPIIRAAEPLVRNGVSEVEQFLNRQGLNTQTVSSATRAASDKAGEAYTYAAPSVRSATSNIQAGGPQVLAQYLLGLVALYYLGPPVLKGVFGSLRGFAGEISPAAALDAVATDGDAVIIDIRTANEKEYTGVPDLPYGNRLIELEYAAISDRKIRGQLRNVGSIEKQITVLQIASLKRVKKRSRVLLLDKNGSGAKDIAKALSRRGYKRVFVISNGFNGWTSSKLQTKGSSSVSSVEILGPLFGGTGRSDRQGARNSRRALPSGR